MTHRDRILAAASILFLAGCATASATAGDTNPPGAAPLAITHEPVTLKTPKRVSQESWSGPDKIKHFFISAFIESLTFSGLQATGASRNTAFAGAIVTTAAFGIGREVHDKRTKGIFSIPDLGWNAAGAGAAALVLRSTQR